MRTKPTTRAGGSCHPVLPTHFAPGAISATRKTDHLVFINANGGALELNHLADRTHEHLAAAASRAPTSPRTGELKRPFGRHCFRRSFVTPFPRPRHERRLGRPTHRPHLRPAPRLPPSVPLARRAPARCCVPAPRFHPPFSTQPPLGWAKGGPSNGRGGRIRTADP